MLQYILECIAFQLVFLIIYDVFLKRETFFQWNRLYLNGTYIISMVLPWVKIEAMKTTVPESFQAYPEFLWNMNDAVLVTSVSEETAFSISWEYALLFGGMILAALFFAYKLYQIYDLKQKGKVQYFKDFTRIVVANSSMAFSFFKSIFLGDKVIEKDHENILQHELVHIRQLHTYDLMFFEFMRIVGWFNPLVYVYQSRVSELHEFIADAHVAKTHKKEQYQLLLSEVFQTQHISFINQFFKSSLIKKRIVMLTKEKSKQVFKLKYILLVPILVGMLFYTSCNDTEINLTDSEMIVSDIDDMSSQEDEVLFNKLEELSETDNYWEFLLTGENSSIKYMKSYNGSFIKFSNDKTIDATMVIEETRLSNKINDLMEEIISKDSLNASEKGALAGMIYNTYPDGVEGISGERGNVVFEKNQKYSNMTAKYIRLTDERNILLKTSNETSPIIVQLDKQIKELVESMNNSKSSSVTIPPKAIGQSQKLETIPFAKVEQVPVFPGCENEDDTRACFQKSMQRHISKNFRYPEEAQKLGVQGRVAVMFTMNTDGGISNVKVRGPHELLEAEAARIISKLPYLKPGVHEGKEVNVAFSIPITFKLNSDGPDYKILPTNNIADKNVINTIRQYNELVTERNRLLQSSNEKNPIIVNLDQQLEAIKKSIQNQLASENSKTKVEQPDYDNSIDVPFSIVENVPVFPGCEDDDNKRNCFNSMMQQHIGNNFKYPLEAQEKGIQGRVSIMFTVSKDGSIQNVRMRGPDKILEKEAARIISLLPKMTPGKQKGKAVNVPFSIPITFKLQGDKVDLVQKMSFMSQGGISPLFIVNKKETSEEQVKFINPDDIESIFVYKDESAIKKYGEKGKNGVVNIITKKKD